MDSSTTEVYDIIGRLDNFILGDATNTKISLQVYITYKTLLKKRSFMKEAAVVNATKLKCLNKAVSSSKLPEEETVYYNEFFNTIVNAFMDVTISFVTRNQHEAKTPLKYINEQWHSIYEYWMNSNKNTALDEDWVISTIKQPSSKQPNNIKLIFKMFVLRCVIEFSVLSLPRKLYPSVPMFSSLFDSINLSI